VAEDLGFEVGVFSAHAAEWMVTGGIEMCRVTLTELAEQARRICRASNISVLVTGPFGFGNALNVMRAVEELENAGISALESKTLLCL
jgi:carboxyvinyl-carboxyphosphonate phosphorylmutase